MEFRGCLDLEQCLGVLGQRIDDRRRILVIKAGISQPVPDFLFLSFQIGVTPVAPASKTTELLVVLLATPNTRPKMETVPSSIPKTISPMES